MASQVGVKDSHDSVLPLQKILHPGTPHGTSLPPYDGLRFVFYILCDEMFSTLTLAMPPVMEH